MNKVVIVCDQCGLELTNEPYIHIEGTVTLVNKDGAKSDAITGSTDWHPQHLAQKLRQ